MSSDTAAKLAAYIADRTSLPARTVHLTKGEGGWVVAVDDIARNGDPVLIHQAYGQLGYNMATYLQDDWQWQETAAGVCGALTRAAGKAVTR